MAKIPPTGPKPMTTDFDGHTIPDNEDEALISDTGPVAPHTVIVTINSEAKRFPFSSLAAAQEFAAIVSPDPKRTFGSPKQLTHALSQRLGIPFATLWRAKITTEIEAPTNDQPVITAGSGLRADRTAIRLQPARVTPVHNRPAGANPKRPVDISSLLPKPAPPVPGTGEDAEDDGQEPGSEA